MTDFRHAGSMLLFPWEGLEFGCVFGCQRERTLIHQVGKDSGRFSVVNLLNQSFYFSFLWIHWAHLKPNFVDVSPLKGRRNPRFKPSVLVSSNLKSKRDENT